MAQDLRSYLDLVKRRKPGDFEIVSKPVDPRFEITALVVKLEREAKRRPVLLFDEAANLAAGFHPRFHIGGVTAQEAGGGGHGPISLLPLRLAFAAAGER